MNQNFINFISRYKNRRLAVAVSGGVDSMTLMHWLAEMGLRPTVLTMDHGLRAESAGEVEYVARTAASLGLECVISHWNGEKPKSGLEAAAREARYNAFIEYCKENKIDVLLVAHQADDQIETFLMNLGRGSGVYGLSGIRREQSMRGIIIARPLLSVFRRELKDYCKEKQIHYFCDTMNDDENFTRVKIRKNRHLLRDRLLIPDERILTAIDSLSRVRDSIESNVRELVDSVMVADNRAMFSADFLFDLNDEIRLKFISSLIQKIGGEKYPPRLEKVLNSCGKLLCDTKFVVGHCTFRRLGDKILVVPEGASVSFKTRREKNDK